MKTKNKRTKRIKNKRTRTSKTITRTRISKTRVHCGVVADVVIDEGEAAVVAVRVPAVTAEEDK